MPEIRVRTASGACAIELGAGALDALGAVAARARPKARRALVVSDANVGPLYGARARASLAASGLEPAEAVFAAGEPSKRLATVERLADAALAAGLDRTSVVVALGGGVVGDVAGFLAAVYMRGTAHVQAPTTLLAMVDSSVGGKTAVDLAGGKNLVGAFHQPAAVVADPETLATLPKRELAAGAAEAVKAGLLGDAALFELIERSPAELLERRPETLLEVIRRSIEVKRRIVEADEREAGERALLNLGHTFAHALETLGDYRALRHGEAVAVGLTLACRLAAARGRFPEADAARVSRTLAALGLPVEIGPADRARLFELMLRDKKARAGKLRLVLPAAVGRAEIAEDVPEAAVRQVLEESP